MSFWEKIKYLIVGFYKHFTITIFTNLWLFFTFATISQLGRNEKFLEYFDDISTEHIRTGKLVIRKVTDGYDVYELTDDNIEKLVKRNEWEIDPDFLDLMRSFFMVCAKVRKEIEKNV